MTVRNTMPTRNMAKGRGGTSSSSMLRKKRLRRISLREAERMAKQQSKAGRAQLTVYSDDETDNLPEEQQMVWVEEMESEDDTETCTARMVCKKTVRFALGENSGDDSDENGAMLSSFDSKSIPNLL